MSLVSFLDSVLAENAKAISDAEAKAAQWLGAANMRRESGKDDSREIRKAQFWLDRANKLRGWN